MSKRVVIIGAGHNGLVCGCYLARAGFSVTLLERRNIVGGAAVTEEFHPGFKNSTASYTVSLLHPQVIGDLHLYDNGLQILERQVNNFLPLEDGRYLALFPDKAKTFAEVAKFSTRDAQALERYYGDLDSIVPLVKWIMMQTPPSTANGGLSDIFKAFQLSRQFSALSQPQRRLLLKLFTLSAAEFLGEYFESPAITAVFGFDAVVGHFDSPYSPGSAYVLLHHVVGEINGKAGLWGHAVGGMGAITQAMATEAVKLGVEILTDAGVEKINISAGKAVSVNTTNGHVIDGDIFVANVNPRLLFRDLLDSADVPEEVQTHMLNYRCKSGTYRMNVALSGLPRFKAAPPVEVLQGGIIMSPDLDYMDRAFQDARRQGFSKQPIVEMLIPSIVDDSLAPPGQHVASLFCQHFDPALGSDWSSHKAAAESAIFDVIESHAPGFKALIVAKQSHSPFDLEQKFGLIGGDIFHGRLSLEQLFSARPMLGMGQYKTCYKNLYLCGAGTHPGGGVSGIPGHNAAREILKQN